jgi:hypothetical protein
LAEDASKQEGRVRSALVDSTLRGYSGGCSSSKGHRLFACVPIYLMQC